MGARIDNRLANFSAELHDRLVHLGLDLLLEEDFSAFENFVNVRPQLARFRIDDGELLFDAEGECVILYAHRGAANLRQKQPAVIPIPQSRERDLPQSFEAHTMLGVTYRDSAAVCLDIALVESD